MTNCNETERKTITTVLSLLDDSEVEKMSGKVWGKGDWLLDVEFPDTRKEHEAFIKDYFFRVGR